MTNLGWEPGQPVLGEPGPTTLTKRDLATASAVLPELREAEAAARPLWKHPAFIVSIITTVLALVAAAVLLIMGLFSEGPTRVSGLELSTGGANAHLTWSTSGDAPVDLFVLNGDEATDLSQSITGPGEAWVPVGLGEFDDGSCFVVRPSSVGDAAVSLGAAELEAQGAASACVADATS